MCGRYATTQTSATLHQAFEIDLANSFVELEADFNMAPTKLAPVVIGRRGEASTSGPQRELLTARWGLIPSWAKDPSIGSRMINARVETLTDKPAFKKAFEVLEGSKAQVMEDKLRKFRLTEIRQQLRRMDLMKDTVRMVLDALERAD
jgi:hypothetical protein